MAARTPGVKHLRPSHRFPNGGWQVRYRDADNTTTRRTFVTKLEALNFQAKVRHDRSQGDLINPRNAAVPLAEVAEDWYATKRPDLTPKTAAGYRSILDAHVLPILGRRPAGKVTAAEIQRFLAEMGTTTGTKRNVLRVLRAVFQHGVLDNLIRVNPCVGVKPPKAKRKPMLFLTAEQVRTLADAITPEYRTLVLFAAYSGMRAGEIAALQVRAVDFLRGRVTVERSVTDVGGKLHFGSTKTDRVRIVAIPPFLAKLLEDQVADKGPTDLVFTGPHGAPLRHGNYYAKHFKPAVKRAFPEDLHGLRFHDLRHTCASLLIDQGVHPKIIADRLGHSSISITMDRYGHLYGDHDEPIAAQLEGLYQAAQPEKAEVREIRGEIRGKSA